MATKQNNLVALLNAITAETLTELDEQIKERRTQATAEITAAKAVYKQKVEEARRDVRFLETLRRLGAIKLGVEAPKKKRLQKAAPSANGHAKKPDALDRDLGPGTWLELMRLRVAQYLIDNNGGPINGQQLMQRCGIQGAKLGEVMTCPWFHRSEQGWHITPAGRQAVDD